MSSDAHIDVAAQPEQRADRCRGDAVLAGAGLGNHPLLAHTLREQALTERVVDLVRTGVGEILALQEDARAAERIAEPPRFVDRRRPADVVAQQRLQPVDERGVLAGLEIRRLELGDRRDQRLGHESSAVGAVVAACVGVTFGERRSVMDGGSGSRFRVQGSPGPVSCLDWSAAKNSRSLAGSLMPGALSTPDETSRA